MDAYEKSRIINFGYGADNFVQASSEKAKADYNRNFMKSLERVPDATRNGVAQQLIARPSKGSDRFELCSRAGETFNNGDDIFCYGSHWIVVDTGAYQNVYTRGYMERCNLELKCMVDDKLLVRNVVMDTGSYTTTSKEMLYMTRLDREMKVLLPLDDETKRITLGTRFSIGTAIDTDGTPVLICFRVTNIDPSTENFSADDHLLVLNVRSDPYNPEEDNLDLGICNFRPAPTPPPLTNHCEVTCSGDAVLRIGGREKVFKVVYYDANGGEIDVTDAVWNLTTLDDTGLTYAADGNTLTAKLSDSARLGTLYTLSASSDSAGCGGTLLVKAVNMIG